MKSKKKDSVPSIIAGTYGPLWTKWWEGLQPSWRAQEGGILSRNTPKEENWLLLRKGGTAGIYTAIIGLSWWIKAQTTEHDAQSWIMVNDLTWVIHQMMYDETGSGNCSLPKRAREEDTDEVNQRFTKRCSIFPPQFYSLCLYVVIVVFRRCF
jgi:hypothetical protein